MARLGLLIPSSRPDTIGGSVWPSLNALCRPGAVLQFPAQPFDLSSGSNYGLKRTFDIATAAVLCLLLAPLFAVLLGFLFVTRNGGSIFFRQDRIGRDGQVFGCLKFRTMCMDADERLRELLDRDEAARTEWRLTRKLRDDPRITRFGRVLRATSMDELPQLWNVLCGEMSIVGPRPVTRSELDGPYVAFDGVSEYLAVRPGITGLWQVSGRSTVSYESRVALDKAYVHTLSFKRDLAILVRTFDAVLLRRGAC